MVIRTVAGIMEEMIRSFFQNPCNVLHRNIIVHDQRDMAGYVQRLQGLLYLIFKEPGFPFSSRDGMIAKTKDQDTEFFALLLIHHLLHKTMKGLRPARQSARLMRKTPRNNVLETKVIAAMQK